MTNLFKVTVSLILAASVAGCGGGGFASNGTLSTTQTFGSSSVTTLQQTDNQIGTGATAAAGDTLVVSYVGFLYDSQLPNSEGTQFGSSSSFSFVLGEGQVIAGWDQGLVGMQAGGIRTLIIPSSLAYGATGKDSIPPNTALVFTVQLTSVTPPASS